MHSFEPVTVADLVAGGLASVKTGPFGTVLKAQEYSSEGVPVISVGEIRYGSIEIRRDTPRVSMEVLTRLPEYLLRRGDIVFARKGAVDRSAWVQGEQDGWFLGSDGIRMRLGSEIDSRFVSYQLLSRSIRQWILQHSSGTTMASLNERVISGIPLNLPSLTVQRAIAEALGVLDDKIAANTRLAAVAEDLMTAHFDTLAFDNTEGDELGLLSDLVELNPNVARPSELEPVYVEMQSLPTSGMSVSSWTTREPKGGARFQNGDTLLARITPCLENRKTGFVDFLDDGQVGLGSTEYIVMRSRPGIPPVLSYFLAVSERFRTFAIRHMVGTSGRQRVSADVLAEFQVRRPDRADLGRFALASEPVVRLISSLRTENRLLANTRDTLLPQLMSGRLRVKDAEKQVEAVV